MLQSMPLLVEAILLLATVYLYWSARRELRCVQAMHSHGEAAHSAEDVTAVRDVAELLAELQSAAQAAREDWERQNAALQERLERAETAAAELRRLLAQAETIMAPGEDKGPGAARGRAAGAGAASLTLTEAVEAFGGYLRAGGHSQGSTARMLGNVREFATWLGGQRCAELPLSQIDTPEINAYLDHLRLQNYQLSTIRRKLAAINAFAGWAHSLSDSPTPAAAPQPAAEVNRGGVRPPPTARPLPGVERRRAVLALAGQGLDQRTIAARTGLEQEAVRLMLIMGQPAHYPSVKNEGVER